MTLLEKYIAKVEAKKRTGTHTFEVGYHRCKHCGVERVVVDHKSELISEDKTSGGSTREVSVTEYNMEGGPCLNNVGGDYNRALSDIQSLLQELIREVEESKDGAYRERDMLVCALSKLFPSYLARHGDEDKDWEDDWRWIVYIDLPAGQVSWHIHDSERTMFDHLTVKENNWDGHNNERKYQRLQALASLKEPNIK